MTDPTKGPFTKGQKVYQYYTCEPAYIYGSGRCKEECEIIADPFEWDGKIWVPINTVLGPSLSLASNLHPIS